MTDIRYSWPDQCVRVLRRLVTRAAAFLTLHRIHEYLNRGSERRGSFLGTMGVLGDDAKTRGGSGDVKGVMETWIVRCGGHACRRSGRRGGSGRSRESRDGC